MQNGLDSNVILSRSSKTFASPVIASRSLERSQGAAKQSHGVQDKFREEASVFNCHPEPKLRAKRRDWRRVSFTALGLHLVQIFFAQTEVTQDSCQGSLRDIFASVVRNRGILIALGTPPNFMPALCLSPELAAQSPQLLGKFPIGHGTPTVRRSSP